jgi:hypothetical protein
MEILSFAEEGVEEVEAPLAVSFLAPGEAPD